MPTVTLNGTPAAYTRVYESPQQPDGQVEFIGLWSHPSPSELGFGVAQVTGVPNGSGGYNTPSNPPVVSPSGTWQDTQVQIKAIRRKFTFANGMLSLDSNGKPVLSTIAMPDETQAEGNPHSASQQPTIKLPNGTYLVRTNDEDRVEYGSDLGYGTAFIRIYDPATSTYSSPIYPAGTTAADAKIAQFTRTRVLKDGSIILIGNYWNVKPNVSRSGQTNRWGIWRTTDPTGKTGWYLALTNSLSTNVTANEWDVAELPNGNLLSVMRTLDPDGLAQSPPVKTPQRRQATLTVGTDGSGRKVWTVGTATVKTAIAASAPQHPCLLGLNDGAVVLHIAQDTGIHYTKDSGATWTLLSSVKPRYYPHAVLHTDGKVYVASWNGGDGDWGEYDEYVDIKVFDVRVDGVAPVYPAQMFPTDNPVAEPTFSPDGATFTTNGVSVTITVPANHTIRYTVNGADPTTTTGTAVAGTSVTLNAPNGANTTIRAIAIRTSDGKASPVRARTFTDATPNLPTAPTFSPAGLPNSGASFTTSLNVTIDAPDSGCIVRYTLDGSDPRSSGTALGSSDPEVVALSNDATIRATAKRTADTAFSPVVTASYDKVSTPVPVDPPTFDQPNNATYEDQASIGIVVPTGHTVRWTTGSGVLNGTTGNTSNPAVISTLGSGTLRAVAVRTSDGAYSVESSIAYTVQDTTPVQPAAPTISRSSATFNGTASFTLDHPDSDVTIRYTTDGSDPDNGGTTVNPGTTVTHVASADFTVRAVALRSGASNSDEATADFTYQVNSGQDTTVTGPFPAASFVNHALVGTKDWTNLTAIEGDPSDNDTANVGLSSAEVSKYGVSGSHGLPTVPTGATKVKSLKFSVLRAQTSNTGGAQDNLVRLAKNGVPVTNGIDKHATTVYPTEAGYARVEYTFTEADLDALEVTLADMPIIGLALSVKNSVGGSSTFAKVKDVAVEEIVYATADTVAPPTPTSDKASGEYPVGNITVSLADSEPGVEIWYTTSASTSSNLPPLPDPANNVGSKYVDPFVLTLGENGIRKVKAVAIDAAGNMSDPLSLTFTNVTVAPPTITPASGPQTPGTVSGTITGPAGTTLYWSTSSSTSTSLPAEPNSTLSNYGPLAGNPQAFNVSLASGGIRKIKVLAVDAQGRRSQTTLVTYTG